MGNTNSAASGDGGNVSSDQKYLLGDLSNLAPQAQKLFNLGKQCLLSSLRSTEYQSTQHKSEDGELLQPEFKLFKPMRVTQPLFYGQTYVKWNSVRDVQSLYAFCAPSKTIIYLQPIDEFPDFITNFQLQRKTVNLNLFELLQCFCQIYFSGLDAKVLPDISTEKTNWQFTSRNHSVTEEKQYLVSDFYPKLHAILPSNGLCILGIIWTDLYPQEDLNFVLGESSVKYKSAMFCFGRYEPKGFNKDTHVPLAQIDGSLIWKLFRVISHETCHLLGLQHCTFFHCAMNESSSVEEAISQPLFLCPICLRKLQKYCRFDVLERYKSMLAFLTEINETLPNIKITESEDWLSQCIQFLQE